MKALFVAWQDNQSRRWAPVGMLTREEGVYKFAYTHGAEIVPNFRPFGRMNDLRRAYKSEELFPIFANRVLAKNRPEYTDYLKWLALDRTDHDALEELARTGGLRATDSLELFPCPEPTEEKNYKVYFFSRGLRHLLPKNEERISELASGNRLYLMRDLQNPYDAMALLLRTDDPIALAGYAPRYYSEEFSSLIEAVGPNDVKVTVEKINSDAPVQYRLLCRLVAPWPPGFSPCTGAEFTPLA